VIVGRALRAIAVAIAVAGLADPTWTRERPVRQAMTVVLADVMPDAAQALIDDLRDEYDVSEVRYRGSANPACPAAGGCILVTSRVVPERMTSGAVVLGALRVDSRPASKVVIIRVDTPAAAHLNAASQLRVQLRGTAAGTSRISVLDEGAVVGAASHEWRTASPSQPEYASVLVDWVPLGSGMRRLRVHVSPAGAGSAVKPLAEGNSEDADAFADVGVDVRIDPIAVLIYEPEVTWLGTFVRRALAGDPRFVVHGEARLAPGAAVRRGQLTALTVDALDQTGVVIVAAPDALTAADVDLLERFVRVRGGSVILLPDRRPSGVVTRLLPPIARERRGQQPQPVGSLRASELLVFEANTGVSILESAGNEPVIVSRALGRGRVVISGALDAWRHRDASGQFGRFWAALAADAAAAAGPSISAVVGSPVMNRGERTTVTIETRSLRAPPGAVDVQAQVICATGEQPVRVWPGARPGTYEGTIVADGSGACRVHARVGERQVAARLVITNQVERPFSEAALEAAIGAHGGIVADGGDHARLAARARDQLPARRENRPTHPFRSPWWIAPFAACLGGEWFLRRRRGLR
jgi:hypothetical protein